MEIALQWSEMSKAEKAAAAAALNSQQLKALKAGG